MAGDDTLDYSAYTDTDDARRIVLSGTNALGGFDGTDTSTIPSMALGFTSIDILVGSASNETDAKDRDAIFGLNGNTTYNITVDNGGNLVSGGEDLAFTSVENLYAGTGDDTFNFYGVPANVSMTGQVYGGAGYDIFDYNANGYTADLTINLQRESVTNIYADQDNGMNGVEEFRGGAGTDTLIGQDRENLWYVGTLIDGTTNLGNDAGEVTNAVETDRWLYIENLEGGSDQDIFLMQEVGTIARTQTGYIDGNGDIDEMNYSDYDDNAIVINLTSGSATSVFGTAGNGVRDFENAVGGALNDAIFGNALDNVLMGLAGADTIEGRGGNDFIVGGADNDVLRGGAGDDVYHFSDAWGNDVVTENATAGFDELSFNLEWLGEGIGEKIFTQANADLNATIMNGVLTVSDDSAHDLATPADCVANNCVTHTSTPTQIEKITGGYGDDHFYFEDTRAFNTIDGGGNNAITTANGVNLAANEGGYDTLDFLDFTTSLIFNVTGLGTVNGDGYQGTNSNVPSSFLQVFDNINNLLSASSVNLDTVIGPNIDTYWYIRDENLGFMASAVVPGVRCSDVEGTNPTTHCMDFTSVENLTGGAADDYFKMGDDGTGTTQGRIVGAISGQGELSVGDTIDYSEYTTPVSVSLVGGTATRVDNGISGIENVIGSSVAANIIIGDENDNILIGTGADDEIYGREGNDILVGNDGRDILDGGLGNDTAAYIYLTTQGVTVDLAETVNATLDAFFTPGSYNGSAVVSGTDFDALISIENIIGGAGNDTLSGDALDNIIIGFGGTDVLDGRAGNDKYILTDAVSNITINDSGTAVDEDILDFSATTIDLIYDNVNIDQFVTYTGNLLFDIQTIANGGLTVTNTSGANAIVVLDPTRSIETYIGGTGDDTFDFGDAAVMANNGRINGREGFDTIDFFDYTTQRTVTLTEVAAIDGFKGSETTAISASFDNINRIFATTTNTDRITGINDVANWFIGETGTPGLSYHTYTVGTATLIFGDESVHNNTVFDIIFAGSQVDNFIIEGEQPVVLLGGADDDVFTFNNDSARVLGNGGFLPAIDGEAGNDTISFAPITTAPRSFDISGDGTIGDEPVDPSGFAGTVTNVAHPATGTTVYTINGFDNINILRGTNATDGDYLRGAQSTDTLALAWC
jgi:hypothetical protein